MKLHTHIVLDVHGDVAKRALSAAYRYKARLNSGLGNRVSIHLALCKLRQQPIGLLFLFEALVQHSLLVAEVELASQSRGSTVGGDLVMFELLGRCDKPRIAKSLYWARRSIFTCSCGASGSRLIDLKPAASGERRRGRIAALSRNVSYCETDQAYHVKLTGQSSLQISIGEPHRPGGAGALRAAGFRGRQISKGRSRV